MTARGAEWRVRPHTLEWGNEYVFDICAESILLPNAVSGLPARGVSGDVASR